MAGRQSGCELRLQQQDCLQASCEVWELKPLLLGVLVLELKVLGLQTEEQLMLLALALMLVLMLQLLLSQLLLAQLLFVLLVV